MLPFDPPDELELELEELELLLDELELDELDEPPVEDVVVLLMPPVDVEVELPPDDVELPPVEVEPLLSFLMTMSPSRTKKPPPPVDPPPPKKPPKKPPPPPINPPPPIRPTSPPPPKAGISLMIGAGGGTS